MDVDKNRPRVLRGITLVELIATLAVVSIALAVVAPGWQALSERSRVTTVANSLLTDLRFARATAVTRNRRVGLCPSDDGDRCNGDPRSWHRGYLVFVDDDGNRDRDPGETLLRRQGSHNAPLRLHSSAGRSTISFRADGAAWSTNTTFSVCAGSDAKFNRAVVLYGSGRARVDRRAPGNRAVHCN